MGTVRGAWTVLGSEVVCDLVTVRVACRCGRFTGLVSPLALLRNAVGCPTCKRERAAAKAMEVHHAKRAAAGAAVLTSADMVPGATVRGYEVLRERKVPKDGVVYDVRCLSCDGVYERRLENLRRQLGGGCRDCSEEGQRKGRRVQRCGCGGVVFAERDDGHVCERPQRIEDFAGRQVADPRMGW